MPGELMKNAPRCNALGKTKKRDFIRLFPNAERDGTNLVAVVEDEMQAFEGIAEWGELYGGEKIASITEDGKKVIVANCKCNRPAYKVNSKCYLHGGKTKKVSSDQLKKMMSKRSIKHGANAKIAINPEGIMFCEFCKATKCDKREETGSCWYEKEISNRAWKGYERDLGELSESDRQLISELNSLLIKKFRYNKYLNFKDLVEEKVWVHPKTGKPISYDKLAVGLSQMLEITPQIIAIMRELKATRAIREPEPERHEFIFQIGKKEELAWPDNWQETIDVEPEERIDEVDSDMLKEKQKEPKITVKKTKNGKTEVEVEDFVWS